MKKAIPICQLFLLLVALCLPATSPAREMDAKTIDSIAEKYKNESAVITDYTEHLVVKNEDGKLVAQSSITEEKLLIGDMAPGVYNRDYVYHSAFHKLISLDANSYNPSGYKKNPSYDFHTIHSERDNVFYDDSKETVVSFSGLLQKSVTETKYTLGHTELHMLPDFYFQEGMYILHASFEVTVPKYVNISFALKGTHTDWIKQTKEETANTITYKFTATDIPALKEYDDVPSVMYYMPHVIPYITSYKLPGADKATNMLGDPAQLYAYLYKHIRNLNIQDDELIDKTVQEVTKGDTGQLQKAAHIYQWVQKNMHYIAFEDGLEGFVPRQAAAICRRKYGDCKDMTSILVAMCRKAGLDAHFTWIGTREKPYTYEETPVPLVANHMICALRYNNDWIFMDGTHPLIPFGQSPDGIQGKEALIAIDANTFRIITVPTPTADKNLTVDSTIMHITDKNISGVVKLSYKGYPAWDLDVMMMYYRNERREKEIRSLVKRGSNSFVQTKYELSTGDSGTKDAGITAEFTMDNYLQKVGRQYYVNMNLQRRFENEELSDTRVVPYFFKYREKIKEIVVLDIPKGYRVSSLPPAAQGSVDDTWSYKVTYKSDGKKVILVKEYEVRSLTAAPALFAEHNTAIESLKKLYKESVVLTAN